MLEFFFSPNFLLGLAAGLAAGALVGEDLGRRSGRARYDELEDRLSAEIQDLRAQLRK